MQQGAHRCVWVGRPHHGSDHRTPDRAGFQDRRDAICGDASDSDHGNGNGGYDGSESLQADRSSGLGLRRSGIDGSAPDIVGALADGPLRSCGIVGRIADQEGWGSDPARSRDREVVGAQVNAIGGDRKSEIDAVVDKEERAASGGEGAQRLCEGQHMPGRKVFFAELQGRGAGVECGAGNFDDIRGVGMRAVGDDDEP